MSRGDTYVTAACSSVCLLLCEPGCVNLLLFFLLPQQGFFSNIYSRLSESAGDGFQGPFGYQSLQMLKSHMRNVIYGIKPTHFFL